MIKRRAGSQAVGYLGNRVFFNALQILNKNIGHICTLIFNFKEYTISEYFDFQCLV